MSDFIRYGWFTDFMEDFPQACLECFQEPAMDIRGYDDGYDGYGWNKIPIIPITTSYSVELLYSLKQRAKNLTFGLLWAPSRWIGAVKKTYFHPLPTILGMDLRADPIEMIEIEEPRQKKGSLSFYGVYVGFILALSKFI